MKYVNRVGLIAAAAVISAVAVAQTAAPAKSAADAKVAIDARQEHFKEIKKFFEPLGAMLKPASNGGRALDTALVATNAARLQTLATEIPAQFNVDTRAFKDIKTDARDAIWISAADFKVKSDAMGTAAAAAASVARTGDAGATKKALIDMGKTCGACHDNFKAKTT
jgi:cytochrome c556